MRGRNILAAEIDKLRTLPAMALAAAGTIALGVLVTAGMAVSAADQQIAASASTITLWAVPFVQVGVVILGMLPIAHEYAGRQIRTTLVAVPGRGSLLAGKVFATAIVLLVTGVVSLGANIATAGIVQRILDAPVPTGGESVSPALLGGVTPGQLCGAVTYLVLIGMLASVVALAVRSLTPALVGMLSLIVIVSPVLTRYTEQARWLPDLAGMRLYASSDDLLTSALLTPTVGGLVLLAWIVAVGAVAGTRFVRHDG